MVPVVVLNTSPAGNPGLIEYPVTAPPPVTVGVKVVIGVPTVPTVGVVYDKALGATAFTVSTTGKVVFPPELVAVTV